MGFTKEQEKAVTTSGTNIIVSAGAGSGKTHVLTGRVVHFVKDKHYKLNEFLILTFTNLAAGEMKNRIRNALTKEKLEEANNVDYSDICTFDSFALSLVKKYHFELNLSPDVSIIDSNIIDVRKRTIIESLFEEEYKKEASDFQKMIERFCFKDDDNLRQLLLDFYNQSLLEIDSEGYIDNFINNFYSDEIIDTYKCHFIHKFERYKESLIPLINQLPEEVLFNKEERTVKQIYLDYFSDFLAASTYDEYMSSIKEAFGRYTLPKGYKDVGEIRQKIRDIIDDITTDINKLPINESEFKNYFKSCIPFAEKLIELLKKLDSEIQDFKEKYQYFEFTDIAKKALFLVKNNEEIRLSLKNQYKMICVDEYQDTSALQEEFINLIANNNLYMVGDIKQSIYRFRNARCDIFRDKYNQYKAGNGGIAIDMNANFRSRKEVLDDINFIFKQLMSDKYGDANYAKDHVIQSGNKAYEKAGKTGDSHHIDIIVTEKGKGTETAETDAHVIARDIVNKINSKYLVMDKESEKLRPCCLSDFCILMDRGTRFDIYAKIFNEYNIPLHVESDEDISENDVVSVLTNLLILIKSIKENDYKTGEFLKAYLSVARSFIFEYTDEQLYQVCSSESFFDDAICKHLRDLINENNYLSDDQLFEKVIYDLDIYSKFILVGNVTKCEKYLDTFLSMFKTMSKLDYKIDDFIIFMKHIDKYDLKITLSSSGSSINSVQIMNIHKSKGLEFNIVYYSGLQKNFFRGFNKQEFGVSSRLGLIMPPEDFNHYNILKVLNSEYETLQDTSEKIRLFYVALTRTREKMICVLQSNDYEILINQLRDKEYKDYLSSHKFQNNEKMHVFNNYFNDFKEKNICFDVFERLCCDIKITLPEKFVKLTSEERIGVDFDDLKTWIEEEKTNIETNGIVDSIKTESVITNTVKLEWLDQIDSKLKKFLYGVFEKTKEKLFSISKANNYLGLLGLHLSDSCIGIVDAGKDKDINSLTFEESIVGNPLLPNGIDTTHGFLNVVINSLKEGKLDDSDIYVILSLYYEEVPFKDILLGSLKKLYEKELTTEAFKKGLKLCGFELTAASRPIIESLYSDLANIRNTDFSIDDFISKPFNALFKPTLSTLEYLQNSGDFLYESILKELFNAFLTNSLSLEQFIDHINFFNFELCKDYEKLSLEEQHNYTVDNLNDVLVEKGVVLDNLEKSTSFAKFLEPFINHRNFKHYVIETETKNPKIDEYNYGDMFSLNVQQLDIKLKEVNTFRPSKVLTINVSKDLLELGTNLHLAMEVTDFVNPCYDNLDPKVSKFVKKFLASDLCKNISQGKVYKEYEFYDSENDINGIIDCFIVYFDHIDIIDYKTKHIDDESYDKQLAIYRTFIENTFKLPTNTYLYSLIDGTYRKTS